MTQVPSSRPQRPAAVPVVPEPATPTAEPSTGRTEGLPDDLHNALVLAIWQTSGVPIATAAAVAEQIGANDKLLDALVAYRRAQQPPLDQISDRSGLAALPTGSIVRTPNGHLWEIDHGPDGEFVDGRTRIRHLEPVAGQTFYPANFDLSMPVDVLYSPEEES